ncbi:MAG: 30S ribosomal protein S6 [Gemmatimonadales bacterium]|nr:30S ribosomal protein S6 [Gemmatimonadales bacterium]
MARPYEVVFIFDPILDEEAINQKLASFHALVAIPGAEATPQYNHWGKRTLSYPIRKRDTGYYVIANFDAEATALPEFERAIKLDEGVIRHLIVLNDEPPTPAQVAAVKSEYEEEE